MSRQGNKALIGAFVVGAVVVAVLGVVVFGSGKFFSERQICVMHFDGDLKGLNVGAPVAFRGVRVGQVTDIKVFFRSDTLNFSIPVTVEIDSQRFHSSDDNAADLEAEAYLQALIGKGLRAQLSLQSIVTGQLQIQLDIYPDAPLDLKGTGEALEIPTIPSRFELLTKALEEVSFKEVVRNVNQAVTQFGAVLEKKEVEAFFSSIEAAAEAVARLARHLDGEAQTVTRSINRAAGSVDRFFQSAERQIDPAMDDAQATLAALNRAADQAQRTLASIDTLAQGYAEQSAFRYEVSRALREISAAAQSLRALTDMLQQQPDALIRGKGAPGGPE